MNVQFYDHLFANHPDLQKYIQPQIERILINSEHGHFPKWQDAVDALSHLKSSELNLQAPVIQIGKPSELNYLEQKNTEEILQTLHPWRKGPFNFFGIHIDSEWRCDMKWARIQRYLPDLTNKTILDVGSGNGYYMLRMLGAGAESVIGVDPSIVFVAQFYALTQCLTSKINAHLLPISFEDLNKHVINFDAIFSMGVLYHRRDPKEHLQRLLQHLKPGGTVFVETLVIDTNDKNELIPEDRYAGMRNVWSVPSPNLVQHWLSECGYIGVKLHDIQTTTVEEQRATPWMQNYSLINFLDSNNQNKTIEGYPAPTRAIFSAHKSN